MQKLGRNAMQVRPATVVVLAVLLLTNIMATGQTIKSRTAPTGTPKAKAELLASQPEANNSANLLALANGQQSWADAPEVGVGPCAAAEKNESKCVPVRTRWLRTCNRVLTSGYDQIVSIRNGRENFRKRFFEVKNDPERVRKLAEAGEIFDEDAKKDLPESTLERLKELAGNCLWSVALQRLDEPSKNLAQTSIGLRVAIDAEITARNEYANDVAVAALLNSKDKRLTDNFDNMVSRYNALVEKYNRLLSDYDRAADAYNSLSTLTRAYLESQRTSTPRITFPQPAPPQRPIHCTANTVWNTTSIDCW
jgi:hypothetical protein